MVVVLLTKEHHVATQTKIKVVMKELWFDLTEEDYANKARRIAQLQESIEAEQEVFDTAKAKFKAAEQRMESEIGIEVRAIRRKKEERLVECNQVHDFARAEVYYEHGGTIYERRAMELSERQPSLFATPNDAENKADWLEQARKVNDAKNARAVDEDEDATFFKNEAGKVTGGEL